MKKVLRKLNNTALLIIGLTALLIYFALSAFFIHNNNNTLRDQIDRSTSILNEAGTREITYTEEDNKYFSLKQQLSELEQQGEQPDEYSGVKAFLNKYDESMDYNVKEIDLFSEKQKYISGRFADLFTESAFKATDDYKKVILSETYTLPVSDGKGGYTGEYVTEKNKIDGTKRDIARSYINQRSDGTFSAILMIKSTVRTDWEFQKLTISKSGDTYVITEFEILPIRSL